MNWKKYFKRGVLIASVSSMVPYAVAVISYVAGDHRIFDWTAAQLGTSTNSMQMGSTSYPFLFITSTTIILGGGLIGLSAGAIKKLYNKLKSQPANETPPLQQPLVPDLEAQPNANVANPGSCCSTACVLKTVTIGGTITVAAASDAVTFGVIAGGLGGVIGLAAGAGGGLALGAIKGLKGGKALIAVVTDEEDPVVAEVPNDNPRNAVAIGPR